MLREKFFEYSSSAKGCIFGLPQPSTAHFFLRRISGALRLEHNEVKWERLRSSLYSAVRGTCGGERSSAGHAQLKCTESSRNWTSLRSAPGAGSVCRDGRRILPRVHHGIPRIRINFQWDRGTPEGSAAGLRNATQNLLLVSVPRGSSGAGILKNLGRAGNPQVETMLCWKYTKFKL